MTTTTTIDELTYDDEYDFLIFKVDRVSYRRSEEIVDLVIDLGPKNEFGGFRLFNASERLNIPVERLRKMKAWTCDVKTVKGTITIELTIESSVHETRTIEQTSDHDLPPVSVAASS
jgi:uncharacterized protein YuzE